MDMFVYAVRGRKGLPLVSPREAAALVSVMEAIFWGLVSTEGRSLTEAMLQH